MSTTFNKLNSVKSMNQENGFVANIEITIDGVTETVDFIVDPTDNYGLSPLVRNAVNQHISLGKPVIAYTPPSAAEIRATMPTITPRQLFLALDSIGITEEMITTALADDPAGLIELRWATSFKRTHPLIDSMGVVFSLTPEQIDSLWMWAKEI